MQIPGGDLAPARRRRYGGGYGRRRRRRGRRLAIALLLVLAAAVVYLLTRGSAPAPASHQAAKRCPTASPTPSATVPPTLAPPQVRLTLLNGTSRNGLARTVGAQLAARGFVVESAATAPAALAGASQVAYGPGGLSAATLVSSYVLGSRLVSAPQAAAGSVQVTLGSQFQRLASPAELATAVPLPLPSPSPTASAC